MQTGIRSLSSLLFVVLSQLSSLAFAKPEANIQIAGVPATVQKVALKINDSEMMDELVRIGGHFGYQIDFGKLTRDQFENLVKYFKKTEPVAYNPQGQYQLQNFLPGKMQALLNKRLDVTERQSDELDNIDLFYKNSGKIFGSINCWGTAWEMVRDPSIQTPLYALLSSRREVWDALQSLTSKIKPESVSFDDLLLLYTNENGEKKLQHAAVAIGYGYYFERTDAGSEPFFRIVHLDDMRGRLKNVFSDKSDDRGQAISVGFELRRVKTVLPRPDLIFSAAVSTAAGKKEYIDALPVSENKSKITLFTDDRFGGGDETTVQDILTISFRINPKTGLAELDPQTVEARLLHESGD